MNEEWITTKAAAEIISVTRNHVRYLIQQGILEAKKFGPVWMVNRESAERYAATERKPGPKPSNEI